MVKMKTLDQYLTRKEHIIKPALEELAGELGNRVSEAIVLDGGVMAVDIIRDMKELFGANMHRPLGQIGLRARKTDNNTETVVFALIGDDVMSLNLNRKDPEVVDLRTIQKDSVKKITSKKLGIAGNR